MSSIAAKITAIGKASSDAVPGILSSIAESMSSTQLNDTEISSLSQAVIQIIEKGPPASVRSALTMCEHILNQNLPPKFHQNLCNAIKTPLSNQNKQLRDFAITNANTYIEIMSPEVFWKYSADSLTSKSALLKESCLSILHNTLIKYPEFKVAAFARSILALLKDPSSEVRERAYETTGVLYQRNSKTVENLLKRQYSLKAGEIISKLSGAAPPATNPQKSAVEGSYAAVSSAPQLSNEEVLEGLIQEFENPYPDVKPKNGQCPFEDLKPMMCKTAEWRDRVSSLETIVSYAKGTQKADVFVRDLRTIQDEFVACLTDARSALCKNAALCLVLLAQIFKGQLDKCSNWLIQPLLGRTTHGTAIISMSAELAITKYVTYVSGKQIKLILEDNKDNAAIEVRVTVVKSMLIAKNKWPHALTMSFDQILMDKQRDPSDKVRQLVLGYNPSLYEPTIDIAELLAEEREESPIPDATQEETAISTIQKLIDDRNTSGLVEILKQEKPDLMGSMQSVIDLIIMDLNEEGYTQVAQELLSIACNDYTRLMYPFISQIINDIPEDEKTGMNVIMTLSQSFGELPIAKLLGNAHQPFANEFIMSVAEKSPSDIEFACKSIFNAVTNQCYDRCHKSIIFLLKKIHEADSIKCEALFGSLPMKGREEILIEIEEAIPQLYKAYARNTDDSILDALSVQMEKAKAGEQIDINIINQAKDTNSILLAIAAIRESKSINQEYVTILLQFALNPEKTIEFSASSALQTIAERGDLTCKMIADSFVMHPASFKALSSIIKNGQNEDDVSESLQRIKEQIAEALSDVKTKYAAIGLLATACVKYGDEYKSLCGELPQMTERLLDSMIQQQQDATADI